MTVDACVAKRGVQAHPAGLVRIIYRHDVSGGVVAMSSEGGAMAVRCVTVELGSRAGESADGAVSTFKRRKARRGAEGVRRLRRQQSDRHQPAGQAASQAAIGPLSRSVIWRRPPVVPASATWR